MTIPADYDPFPKGVFCPLSDVGPLSAPEHALYINLRDSAVACQTAEAEADTATKTLHAAVRDLRDAEAERAKLPKLNQQDLLRACLAANRR